MSLPENEVKLSARLSSKRKVANKFNPPHQPIYLGIFANDENVVKTT